MKVSKKLIAPALTIAVFGAMAVGTTYALFTSNAKTDIAISSGKVNVTADANISSARSLGATKSGETVDETITFTGDDAKYSGDYTWHDATVSSNVAEFENGGSISVVDGNVVFENITPGDEASFAISVENNSTINFKYRYIIECTSENAASLDFCSKLDFTFKTDSNTTENHVKKYVSKWSSGTPGEAISDYPFTVYLPIQVGNSEQEKSCSMKFTIEAVQGNAYVSDADAGITYIAAAQAKEIKVDQAEEVKYEVKEMVGPAEVTTVSATVPADSAKAVATKALESATDPDATYNVNLGLLVDKKDNEDDGAVDLDISLESTLLKTKDGVTTTVETNKVEEVSKYVVVNVQLEDGLKEVKVTHSGHEMVNKDVSTINNGYGLYQYNKTTGLLVIETKTFSPFVVSYNNKASTITMSKESFRLFTGSYKEEQMYASFDIQGKDKKVWSSSDDKVATVDQNGKVVAVGEGTATITVKSDINDLVVDTCEVTVVDNKNATVSVSSQEELNTAVLNAVGGDVIEIAESGEYKIPNFEKAITIRGKEGKTITSTYDEAVGSLATFHTGILENIKFVVTKSGAYYAFNWSGKYSTYNYCEFETLGALFIYDNDVYNGCKFTNNVSDYNLWTYGGNISFTNCEFDTHKAGLNIYNEGGPATVSIVDCLFVFIGTSSNKPAILAKSNMAGQDFVVNFWGNNTASEGFTGSDSDTIVVDGIDSHLFKREGNTPGAKLTVYKDGVLIYTNVQ